MDELADDDCLVWFEGERVVQAVGGLMRGRDVRAGELARGGLCALRAWCERFFSARARWMS